MGDRASNDYQGRRLTADEFIAMDQRSFGTAWRYELVDGVPVPFGASTVKPACFEPAHGAIIVNLGAALKNRLPKGAPCRVEVGTAAVPRGKQRNRARIPDLMIRCAGTPKVLIEVLSPADEHSQVVKAERYRDLKAVDGVAEIVEVVQDEYVCRVHRWRDEIAGWQMTEIIGADAVLSLASVAADVPLAEIYDGVLAPEPAAEAATPDAEPASA